MNVNGLQGFPSSEPFDAKFLEYHVLKLFKDRLLDQGND